MSPDDEHRYDGDTISTQIPKVLFDGFFERGSKRYFKVLSSATFVDDSSMLCTQYSSMALSTISLALSAIGTVNAVLCSTD